ncbi:MAG TPA: sigma-70 family RNA polymerase sigma factor [Blastocatellia bacterium]|nr:sigma-70 family RNA polymerase sigma factor [Blastocatellia bacterium]
MSIGENELIRRAQAGDGDSFCLLAKGYQRRIYSLALSYCRDPHDAEDLSQEVWLKAFKAIGSFRGESSFYTWLRQITVNSFLNHRRGMTVMVGDKSTTVKMEELETVTEMDSSPIGRSINVEDQFNNRIMVDRVMQALDELTPQQRLMFLLKHREGMTYEEISKSFGCTTGTVKKALFRAVLKLREHLGINIESEDCSPFSAGSI